MRRNRILLLVSMTLIIIASVSVLISSHYSQRALDIITNNDYKRTTDITTNHDSIVECMGEELAEFKCDTCLGGYEEDKFEENSDRGFELCLERTKSEIIDKTGREK